MMPATQSAMAFAEVPAAVDEEEFLTKVSEILGRLKAQSDMRGHPFLASLLAIARDEAVDDLRTRLRENGEMTNEADEAVMLIAQRFSFRPRHEEVKAEEPPKSSGQLLSFSRG